MAVVLRLARYGRRNAPFYRVVACDKIRPRDGKFIEVIGQFDPTKNPSFVNLKTDRVQHWVSQGAVPSEMVRSLIRKTMPNFIEEREAHKLKKVQAARKARKARAAKKAKAK